MAHTAQIFEEDEVSLTTDKGIKFGLIVESTDNISSDEEDNDLSWDRLKRGHVRVAWHPDGVEEDVEENKLLLRDRSLMPGDVVRRLIEGQDSQRGYIRSTTVYCNVQIIGKNKVICGIDSRDLPILEEWDEDSVDVYLDSWVGKVDYNAQDMILRFSDGAKVQLDAQGIDDNLHTYEDIYEKRDRCSAFCVNSFYVGQKLRGELGCLADANWLVTTKRYNPQQAREHDRRLVPVTVEKMETTCVEVAWLCQGCCKSGAEKSGPPPRKVEKEDIKRLLKLNAFEACSMQIGDHAVYTLKEQDTIQNIAEKGNKTIINYVIRNKLGKKAIHSDTHVQTMNVRNSTTMDNTSHSDNISNSKTGSSDVQGSSLQTQSSHNHSAIKPTCDGIQSAKQPCDSGEAAADLQRVTEEAESVGEGEPQEAGEEVEVDDSEGESTCSGSYAASTSSNSSRKKCSQHKKGGGTLQTKLLKKKKLRKTRRKEEIALWEYKPGDRIPVEVISTESVAEVMWQDGTIESGVSSTELYPIHHLDEQEFFPGDIVVSAEGAGDADYGVVQSVDHAGRTCALRWIKLAAGDRACERVETEEVSVYDIREHSDYRFRPGALVVRVGGYEQDESGVAAGQVYQLQLDGRVKIQWADRSRSLLYPQQLYLIGDDLSELDELEVNDSSSSSSVDGSDSTHSWETEEEHELSDQEQGASEAAASAAVAAREAVERGFTAVTDQLQALEEIFALSDIDFSPADCFAEVLQLYKLCRKLGTKLDVNNFQEPKLRKMVANIREELKKDKTARFTKRIKELIEQNLSSTAVAGNDSASASEAQPKTEVEDGQIDCACAVEAGATGNTVTQGTQTSEEAECAKCAGKLREMCQKTVHALREIVIELREERTIETEVCAVKEIISSMESDLEKAKIEIDAIKKSSESLKKYSQELDKIVHDNEATLATPKKSTGANESDASKLDLALPTVIAAGPGGAAAELPVDSGAAADTPGTPQTPGDVRQKISFNRKGFTIEESAPSSHKFAHQEYEPNNAKSFLAAVMKDHRILTSSLPLDIFVKGYEDRMDLFSVMIYGPKHTPYEDGLFFFDVKLPNNYPVVPPQMHYVAYCTERLNPNLYEDGKVCVSLLGTWAGRGTEVWTAKSTLLQVLISIQGLILVSEPYYNEAGYERQKGSQQGLENSRMYNEMVLLKLVQSMTRISQSPPEVFNSEVKDCISVLGPRLVKRLEYWLDNVAPACGSNIPLDSVSPKAVNPAKQSKEAGPSQDNATMSANRNEEDMDTNCVEERATNQFTADNSISEISMPEFPLLPVSKGFVLTFKKLIVNYKKVFSKIHK